MIEVQLDGDLTRICLNRPEKANALTAVMLEDLIKAVRDNQNQKVLILTGSGKVFSAGADLDAAKAGLATSPLWHELSTAIAAHRGLTIAALNGSLAGGAFGMALACDLRVSVDGAKFFYPVMKLGFLPQPFDPPRLKELVGVSGAKSILLAGQKLSTQDALRIGLVDQIADDGDVLAAANRLAEAALSADFAHIEAIKTMI